MAKVNIYTRSTGGRYGAIMCPGCGYEHPFTLDVPSPDDPKKNLWTFNEDLEKPTFMPSMLVWESEPTLRCHSFVKDGQIQFLGDCFHDLKNTIVELPEIDY